MNPSPEFDRQRAEAFGGRMLDMLTGASTMFMISIGHEAGLFDAMAELPPSSSEEIARATNLNERYVREWLNQLVSARVLD